jgi:hypothetical protein
VAHPQSTSAAVPTDDAAASEHARVSWGVAGGSPARLGAEVVPTDQPAAPGSRFVRLVRRRFRGLSRGRPAGRRAGALCEADAVLSPRRLILCLPFKRNAAAEELLLRCCLPRAREHCRRCGWTLLAVSINDEVDPDLMNARPDTLLLCRLELDRCHRLSAGPSMLVLLDR